MRIRVHAKSGAKIQIITEIRTIIEELFYLFDIFLLFIFYFMQKNTENTQIVDLLTSKTRTRNSNSK